MRIIFVIDFGNHPNAPKVLLGENLPPLIFLWNRLPQFWRVPSLSGGSLVEVGSMKLDLHRLAVKIFQFCAEHNIRLEVQWIPRTENEKADYISRLIDFDDWQITPEFLLRLEELWGPHTVDCFANFYTAKLPRFLSRFWNGDIRGRLFCSKSRV